MGADTSKATARERALSVARGINPSHHAATTYLGECGFCEALADALIAFAASERAELLAALRDEREQLLSILRGCVDAFEAIGNRPIAYNRALIALAKAESPEKEERR